MEPIVFEPTYQRDNGLSSLDLRHVPAAGFDVRQQSLVIIPPGEFGGDHRHPRQEAFVALGPGLELLVEVDGTVERHAMVAGTALWHMPSQVPHAIVNTSDHPVAFYEMADGPQHDVERCNLIARSTGEL